MVCTSAQWTGDSWSRGPLSRPGGSTRHGPNLALWPASGPRHGFLERVDSSPGSWHLVLVLTVLNVLFVIPSPRAMQFTAQGGTHPGLAHASEMHSAAGARSLVLEDPGTASQRIAIPAGRAPRGPAASCIKNCLHSLASSANRIAASTADVTSQGAVACSKESPELGPRHPRQIASS